MSRSDPRHRSFTVTTLPLQALPSWSCPVIAVLGVAHFIELSSEQIFRPHDKRFDLSVEGRRIGRCVSSRHIAPRTELCNCRINAVKFDRLDAPFAERVFCR